jgi:hypothetical protein
LRMFCKAKKRRKGWVESGMPYHTLTLGWGTQKGMRGEIPWTVVYVFWT